MKMVACALSFNWSCLSFYINIFMNILLPGILRINKNSSALMIFPYVSL
ncbi:hypothetical protein DCCM_0514 [Desulfocucumis palustris]|uniref:Uncharacterized protein n=1 Tax=Desulfocucumis palustris TaxID=1898651 RepID=A0A2L2X8I9_9FIRM|nr:hypothetical protein DCCM_0514 [Desulfocucumis palustris]